MICVIAIGFGWTGAVVQDAVVEQMYPGCTLQVAVVRHGARHAGLAALITLVGRAQMVSTVKTT